MKVTIREGLEFEMNEGAINDWRLAEMLTDLEEGNPFMTVKIARFILTPEGYQKLKDLNTDEKGHIDAEGVELMLTDIMLASDQTKK